MTTLTPEEQALEQHIVDCGHRIAAAFAAQDLADARMWQARMYDAINSRTPEHQDKMHARIDAAIDPNWFQSEEALELGRQANA